MSDINDVLGLEQAAVRCPFPAYAKLRSDKPVSYSDEGGFFVVTRYEDVEAIANDPSLFSNQNPMGPSVSAAVSAVGDALTDSPDLAERSGVMLRRGSVLFSADPPAHTRHRKLLARAFSPRMVERFEPELRKICHALIDAFIERGEVELVSDFAFPLPMQALATLLGVPTNRREDFRRWAAALNAAVGADMPAEAIREVVRDQLEFWEYFSSELEARKSCPGSDLLTAIAQATVEGEAPLTSDETLGLVSQLIAAGIDTTRGLISSAVTLLCRDPVLARQLRDDPPRIARFVEEALRLESPVQGLFRVATRDTEVAGMRIPAGSHLWLAYGSANSDEAVFPHPRAVDIDRGNLRSHVGFGHGIHFCIGSTLARAETRIALEALVQRLGEFSLQDPDQHLEFVPSYVIHAAASLPIRFTARQ